MRSSNDNQKQLGIVQEPQQTITLVQWQLYPFVVIRSYCIHLCRLGSFLGALLYCTSLAVTHLECKNANSVQSPTILTLLGHTSRLREPRVTRASLIWLVNQTLLDATVARQCVAPEHSQLYIIQLMKVTAVPYDDERRCLARWQSYLHLRTNY